MFTTKFPDIIVAANRSLLIPTTKYLSVLTDNVNIFPDTIAAELNKEDLPEFKPTVPGWVQQQVEVSSWLLILWNIGLSVVLAYLLFKKKQDLLMPAIAMSAFPKTEAYSERHVKCYLPTHVELLLWVSVIWMFFITLPITVRFVYRQYRQWRHTQRLRKTMREAPFNDEASMMRTGRINAVFQGNSIRDDEPPVFKL